VTAPAENSHVATGASQAPNDEAPERTGAAGDQDGWWHGSS
jgi:hypothetical protein